MTNAWEQLQNLDVKRLVDILANPAVSGLLVMTIVGALAYKLNFVDISGLISAFVVGFTIWYTGGVVSFVIILFFFLSAGLATKMKYKEKAKQNLAQEGKGKIPPRPLGIAHK